MKLYATDFDGTLSNRPINEELIAEIQAWRNAGNLFGVISGRPLPSIGYSVKENHVPLDFLIGNNGAVIKDMNKNQILDVTAFEPEMAKALIERLVYYGHNWAAVESIDMEVDYDNLSSYSLRVENGGLWIGNDFWPTVTEITLGYPTHEETIRQTKETMELLDGKVQALLNGIQGVDWVAGGVNKAFGIKRLIACLGVSPEKIITTGDSFNDLDMLTCPDFEGYCVENALDEVKEKVGRVIACPHDILIQI